MSELKEFKVTASLKVVHQIKQYEPVTFESRVEATYLSNNEEEIESRQELMNRKCIKGINNQMERFFEEVKQ